MNTLALINKILSPFGFVGESTVVKKIIDKPIPGLDANWNGWCNKCKDSTSKASRGGFYNGSVSYCYQCGNEEIIVGFKYQETIDDMITHSFVHWRKFPRIPYNWHELTESEKWKILSGN